MGELLIREKRPAMLHSNNNFQNIFDRFSKGSHFCTSNGKSKLKAILQQGKR